MLKSLGWKAKQRPPANLAIIASLFFVLPVPPPPVVVDWVGPRSDTRFSFIRSVQPTADPSLSGLRNLAENMGLPATKLSYL